MPISGATLAVGGTVSVAGGTSTAFALVGTEVKGGVQIVDSTNTNAVTRAMITLRNIKTAIVDAITGKYSGKTKRQAQLVRPKVLAGGSIVFPLIRIELETHPDMSDAEVSALLSEGAQLCIDADFANFWKLGATA